MSKFIREVSMTLFDDVLVHTSYGVHSEVKFNFEYCWRLKNYYKPKKITMIHVHPDDCTWMSSIDRNMVKGWALAFWKPINFIVLSKIPSMQTLTLKYFKTFHKSEVIIEDNKPIIYTITGKYVDVYNKILNTKEINWLYRASQNILLQDFYLYLLDRKRTTKIQLPKMIL